VAKRPVSASQKSFFGNVFALLKQTFQECLKIKLAPAALIQPALRAQARPVARQIHSRDAARFR